MDILHYVVGQADLTDDFGIHLDPIPGIVAVVVVSSAISSEYDVVFDVVSDGK